MIEIRESTQSAWPSIALVTAKCHQVNKWKTGTGPSAQCKSAADGRDLYRSSQHTATKLQSRWICTDMQISSTDLHKNFLNWRQNQITCLTKYFAIKTKQLESFYFTGKCEDVLKASTTSKNYGCRCLLHKMMPKTCKIRGKILYSAASYTPPKQGPNKDTWLIKKV